MKNAIARAAFRYCKPTSCDPSADWDFVSARRDDIEAAPLAFLRVDLDFCIPLFPVPLACVRRHLEKPNGGRRVKRFERSAKFFVRVLDLVHAFDVVACSHEMLCSRCNSFEAIDSAGMTKGS